MATVQRTPWDGAAGDNFGFSVAISGDTVVVGASLDDIGANSDQGSAYVFGNPVSEGIPTLSEWAQVGMVGLLVVGGLLALRRRSGQALRRRSLRLRPS
jgi:hypothetical protein